MNSTKKTFLTLVFLFSFLNIFAQIDFSRLIVKKENSDTVVVSYQLKKFKPGEICRIQQKIPTAFKYIKQENQSDTLYFDKDVATSIWLTLPNDTILSYDITLLAPKKSLGYLYLGDCACFYGGKGQAATRKYIPKEKVWLNDTILIPAQDTALLLKIDSIDKLKPIVKKAKKGHKPKVIAQKNPYDFRIQITATKFKQDLKDLEKEVIRPDKMYEEFTDELYKYTIGNFKNYQLAKERLLLYQQQKTNGYIVAYKNGIRVGVKEASKNLDTELIEQ